MLSLLTSALTRVKGRHRSVTLKPSFFVVWVHLPDGVLVECQVLNDAVGQDCLRSVATQVGLKQMQLFGLRYLDKNLTSCWVELNAALKQQLEKNRRNSLFVYLSVMFYVTDLNLIKDPVARRYFYHQLRKDVCEGRIDCNGETAVLLAAYDVQVQFGDYDETKHRSGYAKNTRYLFPPSLTCDDEVLRQLMKQVVATHQDLRGMTPFVAQSSYLQVVRSLRDYGIELYRVKDQRGKELFAGPSVHGIHVRPIDDKKMSLICYRWLDIGGMFYRKRQIRVDLRSSKEPLNFYLSDVNHARYVYKMFHLRLLFYSSTINAKTTFSSGLVRRWKSEVSLLDVDLPVTPKAGNGYSRTRNNGSDVGEEVLVPRTQNPRWKRGLHQRNFSCANINMIRTDGLTISDSVETSHKRFSVVDLTNHADSKCFQEVSLDQFFKPRDAYPNKEEPIGQKQFPSCQLSKWNQRDAIFPARESAKCNGDFTPHFEYGGSHSTNGYASKASNNVPRDAKPQEWTYRWTNSPGSFAGLLAESRFQQSVDNLAIDMEQLHLSQNHLALQRQLSIETVSVEEPKHGVTTDTYHGWSISSAGDIIYRPKCSAGLQEKTSGQAVLVCERPEKLNKCQSSLTLSSTNSELSHSRKFIPPVQKTLSYDTSSLFELHQQSEKHQLDFSSAGNRRPSQVHNGGKFSKVSSDSNRDSVNSNQRLDDVEGRLHSSTKSEIDRENSYETVAFDSSSSTFGLKQSMKLNETDAANLGSNRLLEDANKSNSWLPLSLGHRVCPSAFSSKMSRTHRREQSAPNVTMFSVNSGVRRIPHREHFCPIHETDSLTTEPASIDLLETIGTSGSDDRSALPLPQPAYNRRIWETHLRNQSVPNPDFSPRSRTQLRRLCSTNLGTAGADHGDAEIEGMEPFFLEFDRMSRQRSWSDFSTANRKRNLDRNRFKTILPYEDNRVRLIPTENNPDGYINASHITLTIAGKDQIHYIAAQGPLVPTVDEFWTMVWENGVSVIAMLTGTKDHHQERSCAIYWSAKLGPSNSVCIGEYEITTTHLSASPSHITRGLIVHHLPSKAERLVWQLQYLNWVERGCPQDQRSFHEYLDEIDALRRQSEGGSKSGGTRSPVLVHCSNGVGRTGLFILTDVVRTLIQRNQTVPIPTLLRKLREQRMQMVQTIGQYSFVYQMAAFYQQSSRLI